MKASDLFVQALEAEGVEYIFGIPGEENLDFLDSLSKSNIKLVLTRIEQAAGFMAATYGRLTGKPGVCLSTLGPGATNFVTAAAYAQLGGMPMLMITGQKPVKHSKQGQFQIVDVVAMMEPLTKYTRQLVSATAIPSRVREAFRLAEEEKPGAVHLELPEDVAAEQTDQQVIPASHSRRPIAEDKSIVRAVELIEKAKHPLFVLGAGANRKRTCHQLRALVDRFGIPFVTTQMGKGVIDEHSPLFLGNAALSSGDYVHRAIEAADLIINVGHDVVEKPPFFMHADGVQVIHVNFFSAAVDTVYFPQVEVIGDIANSIWRIGQSLESSGAIGDPLKDGAPKDTTLKDDDGEKKTMGGGATHDTGWDFSRFMEVRKHGEAQLLEGADDPRFPVLPQRLVRDVRESVEGKGIIALDNGVYKIWFARNYKARSPNTVLLDNALATMGAGLPSAIGAKLVYPERSVTAICGDGGFMMNSQELETAVRLGLHLVVIILRDNAYGMIKWKQANMGLDNFGLDFGNPDFVKYAECYGANGYRVSATDDLLPLLQKCHAEPGVHVVEVPVDYSENDRILNHEIKERSAKI